MTAPGLFSIKNSPEVYQMKNGYVYLMPFKRKSEPLRHAIRKALK